MRKYTGYTYVKKLERCLRKMPYEERLDAVNYFSEYIAEAGAGREREVIERLGPPQRLAAEIRADAALRELNAKAEHAEMAKARRKEQKRKDKARGGAKYKSYAYGSGDPSGAKHETYVYGSGDNSGANASGAYAYGAHPESGRNDSSGENPKSPGMGESISAAGLGAIGMLAMPIARPLAVLACVLGIIGLVLGVIVVVALFIAAGAIAVGGAFCSIVSLMILPQDIYTAMFVGGAGLACVGAGLILGALNSLLGRAIFKGIANLSSRIRHKRVKIRKETFNYSYAYAGEAAPRYEEGESDGAPRYGTDDDIDAAPSYGEEDETDNNVGAAPPYDEESKANDDVDAASPYDEEGETKSERADHEQ
jgi:uncharacterized membrane protein